MPPSTNEAFSAFSAACPPWEQAMRAGNTRSLGSNPGRDEVALGEPQPFPVDQPAWTPAGRGSAFTGQPGEPAS